MSKVTYVTIFTDGMGEGSGGGGGTHYASPFENS